MTEFAAVILAAALNGAIPGILLTALVAIVLRLTPRRAINAATRYAIWCSTLLVVILLPFLYLPAPARPLAPVAAPTQTTPIAVSEAAPILQNEPNLVSTAAAAPA